MKNQCVFFDAVYSCVDVNRERINNSDFNPLSIDIYQFIVFDII